MDLKQRPDLGEGSRGACGRRQRGPFVAAVLSTSFYSFATPSQDECDVCLSYQQHCKDVLNEHSADSCDTCVNAKSHLDRARKARLEYDKKIILDKKRF